MDDQACDGSFQPKTADILQEMRAEIAPLLTPEQQKKLEELQRENQALLKPRNG
jgi:hypothetical protein